MSTRVKRWLLGKPLDPFSRKHRSHIALVAFLAWIGLGADGLSSSCYGPEQAYLALAGGHYLALYLAAGITLTVFIIAMAYNQVIELFPNGGGGYKVATELLGSYLGLIAGVALLVDYILTIAISLASAVDAVFSFLPLWFLNFKLEFSVTILGALTVLNLRGMKEPIKVLLPIFLGFFLLHLFLIVYGIISHESEFSTVIRTTVIHTHEAAASVGWLGLLAFLFRAYSMGGGTYTGLEAVSNNVNVLAEPRIRTGKWTMFYMALSLSLVASGIILLYLLWHVEPEHGKTLNAVVFEKILGQGTMGHLVLVITLLFEAGILFVGANTGFLGGPAVLSNMAIDNWVPTRFRHLSSRLVSQNGIILFGVSAALILLGTNGHVSTLVILYTINVFLAFSISILGLCVYWFKGGWKSEHFSIRRLLLSLIGFVVCFSILIATVVIRFTEGGYMAILLTASLILLCLNIKKNYAKFNEKIKEADELLTLKIDETVENYPALLHDAPTAVILVDRVGAAMHTMLKVLQYFPDRFKNFVFISVGVVDVDRFRTEEKLKRLKTQIEGKLDYFVRFSHSKGFAAVSFMDFGTDPVDRLERLASEVRQKFPNCMFFASHYILKNTTWFTSRVLYNELPMVLQRRLQVSGGTMLILPMCIQ
ncbi:MAG TPA: APC family permease [Coxiellaceae bacterium]|nr:APC family permease [Coxiellaceae bacterium]